MYRYDDLENLAFRHHLKNQRGSLSSNHRFRIIGMRVNTQTYCSPLPFYVIPKAILAPWIHPCFRLVSACPELVLKSHGTTATEKRLHVYQRYGKSFAHMIDLIRKHRMLYCQLLLLLSDQRVRASLTERPVVAHCTLSYSCTDQFIVSVTQSK